MQNPEGPGDSDGLPPCPVCGETATATTGIAPRSPYLPDSEFQVVRCLKCGLLRTDPWPTPDQLHDLYESGQYYSTIEASGPVEADLPLIERTRKYVRALVVRHHYAAGGAGVPGFLASAIFRRRFDWAPNSLHPGTLIDVGCGDGAFLLDAQKAGWNVSGLETSETAVSNAKALGLTVLHGSLEDRPFGDSQFDIVRMWSVLEHVPDANAALLEVVRLLKPGGWAIIQVPNADSLARRLTRSRWSGWDLPAHLTHFTPETLRWAVARVGLEPVELGQASVGTLANSFSWTAGSVGRAAVFALDQILDLLGRGDCMVLFACRPRSTASGS